MGVGTIADTGLRYRFVVTTQTHSAIPPYGSVRAGEGGLNLGCWKGLESCRRRPVVRREPTCAAGGTGVKRPSPRDQGLLRRLSERGVASQRFSVLNPEPTPATLSRLNCACLVAAGGGIVGYRCRSPPRRMSQSAFSQSGISSSVPSLCFFFQTRSRRKPHHWSKKTERSRIAATVVNAITATPTTFQSCVPREPPWLADVGNLVDAVGSYRWEGWDRFNK